MTTCRSRNTTSGGATASLKHNRLPMAPDMAVFCHYGHDIPTERAYSYIQYPEPVTLILKFA